MKFSNEKSEPRVPTALRRTLNRWDLAALGINQVIGGAVFLIPSQIILWTRGWAPFVILGVGLWTMTVALCFAEAASRFDTTGGAYFYTRRAFGRFAGFEIAWMQWFTRVASLASVANGIALALSFYLPRLSSGWGRGLVIFSVIGGLTAVTSLGIRQSQWLVNILTVGKLLPLAIVIILGVFLARGGYPSFTPLSNLSVGSALLLLVFAFGGFDVIGIPAGEAKDPRRDVPFAFIVCIIGVTVVLLSIHLVVMGSGAWQNISAPVANTARQFLGPAGAIMVAWGAVLSMIGNNAGQILSGSRTLFALSEQGDLPSFFSWLHPIYRTPVHAIMITAIVGFAMALSGTFVHLAEMSAIARLITYAGTAAAVQRLRQQERRGIVPTAAFLAPGAGLLPIVAILGSVAMLFGATLQQIGSGIAVLIAGGLLFILGSIMSGTWKPETGSRETDKSERVRCKLGFMLLPAVLLTLPLFTFAQQVSDGTSQARKRARELGIVVGVYPTGPLNAITDVAGVLVGQTTIIEGSGPLKVGQGPIRTGVTAIFPSANIWTNGVFAATQTFNGDGEMTGTHWIQDLETLTYPILLTNTGSVGAADDAMIQYLSERHTERRWGYLPVVAETYDGFLNDTQGRHVGYTEVAHALDTAKSGPVSEGNSGGGTGMICYRFKCGTGTSSRKLSEVDGGYTIGVLVQANFGTREQLRIDGVPVGREITTMLPSDKRAPSRPEGKEGSIIIVIATDAPLSSRQLDRVARRAALGMGRTGTTSGNSSGDIFIAFSTANSIPLRSGPRELKLRLLSTDYAEPIFRATVEATEEAILNALTMGQTLEGVSGHTAYGIPYDQLENVMAKYGRPLNSAAK